MFMHKNPGKIINDRLGLRAEYITHLDDHSIILVVGRDNSPAGHRSLIVSKPHVMQLSEQWKTTMKAQSYCRGHFHTGESVPVVALPEDDPDMIRLLMIIAHSRFEIVPQTLELHELVRLARSVERYGIGSLVVPFIDGWLAPHRERYMEAGYEQWLYVAYQFGLEDDYLTLADHFVRNCRINQQYCLLAPTTGFVMTGQYPENAISKCRDRLIVVDFPTCFAILRELTWREVFAC